MLPVAALQLLQTLQPPPRLLLRLHTAAGAGAAAAAAAVWLQQALLLQLLPPLLLKHLPVNQQGTWQRQHHSRYNTDAPLPVSCCPPPPPVAAAAVACLRCRCRCRCCLPALLQPRQLQLALLPSLQPPPPPLASAPGVSIKRQLPGQRGGRAASRRLPCGCLHSPGSCFSSSVSFLSRSPLLGLSRGLRRQQEATSLRTAGGTEQSLGQAGLWSHCATAYMMAR